MAEKRNDLVFEIGSEELPAAFVPRTLARMKENLEKELRGARLTFDEVITMGTPRRLALVVRGLETRQPDITEEVRGPKADAAFDSDGKPTRALQGFARGQGVDPSEVKVVEEKKGTYVYAVKHTEGSDTMEILPEILTRVASADYFPKSMRWGGYDVTFARPVHWILAVYGGRTVALSYGHVKSSNTTRGHRFLSAEGEEEIIASGEDDYLQGLKRNFVVPDPDERRRMISEWLTKGAEEAGGRVLEDPGLVEEVTYLVEYPVVVRGGFEREFLELPRDIVVNAMREHQRYFAVVDSDGGLLPSFLTVAGTLAKDMDVVREGNERVLRARLGDAKFYYEQDVKTPLTKKVDDLKGVVFQARLGTSYEKVERFTSLALFIGEKAGISRPMENDEKAADFLNDDHDPSAHDATDTDHGLYAKLVIGRAAMLAKADLVSGVVGEFPKLQGIMGRVYAEKDGEAPEVAAAVYEHYLPIVSGGELPASAQGSVVSMADKMDTICGCFGVGLKPTGGADPYALRRQSLGIISILCEGAVKVRLDDMVDESLELLAGKLTEGKVETRRAVLEFFKERLRQMLLGRDLSFDTVDAVLSTDWREVPDAVSRVEALEKFKDHPACASLVTAFKRVSNILKGKTPEELGQPDPDIFKEDREKALFETVERIAPEIERYSAEREYEKLFTELASIKDDIDAFFDDVMVMAEDEGLRRNRLALLAGVRDLYFRTADLSKLAV